jgi:hypothetical protein
MFPSEAKHGGAELRREAAGGVVYVRPGDRVTVESVEVQFESISKFIDAHDNEVRLARLRVERPTGEVVSAGPLSFYGAGRLIRHGTREAFDHMIVRVLRHNDLDDLPQAPSWAWGDGLERQALEMARQSHEHALALYDALPADGEPHERGSQLRRSHLRGALNGAALAGYLLGRIEATKATDLADKVMRARAKATAATKLNHVLERGKEIWAMFPDHRRNRVADMICEEYPNEHKRSVMRTLEAIDPHARRT